MLNRFFFTFSLTLLGSFGLAASGATTPIGFSQALRYALEHSPDPASATHAVEISELERKNAVAAFLPSLDVSSIVECGLEPSDRAAGQNFYGSLG
jgi:outer membrane protein TolC